MYSKIKKTVFTTQFYVFMLLGGSVLINACQEQDSAQPQLEEVQYEMYDDQFVTVVLDPSYVSKTNVFETIEQYYNYLNQMEDSGEKVVVNKEKYESLIHYFDPFEISVINENNQVTVGDLVYRLTQEASYKRLLHETDWKMDIFYGLSGDVDLNETDLIYSHIDNLEALKNYDFKSPLSKKIYLDKLDQIDQNGRIAGTTTDYYDWVGSSSGGFYPAQGRSSAYGPVFTYYIRWRCWHETYHQGLYDRAKGGTATQWVPVDNQGNFDSNAWTDIPLGVQLWDFHENNSTDTSTPFVKVIVNTCKGNRNGEAYDWRKTSSSIKRCHNGHAHSTHFAAIRSNNTNISTTKMNGFYID